MSDKIIGIIAAIVAVGLFAGVGSYLMLNYNDDSEGFTLTEIESIDGFTVTYVSGTQGAVKYYSVSSGENCAIISGVTEDTVYTVSGTLKGYISLDGNGHALTINMNGANISSDYESPIFIKGTTVTNINVNTNTENLLGDFREDGDGIQSVLFSEKTMYIAGSGALDIHSTHRDGISTDGELHISGPQMNIDSVGNSIRAGSGFTLSSGTIMLRSHQGSGITTADIGTVKGGAQYGAVDINSDDGDTSLSIFSQRDGIDSAYNVSVIETMGEISMSINTSDMSQPMDRKTIFVGYSNDHFRFSIKVEQEDGTQTIINPSGDPNHVVPMLNKSYVYAFAIPDDTEEFMIYAYESGQIQGQEDDYYAKSNWLDVNDERNSYLITQCARGAPILLKEKEYDGPPSPDFSRIPNSSIRAIDTVEISGGNIFMRSNGESVICGFGPNLKSTDAKGVGDITINAGDIVAFSRGSTLRAEGTISFTGGDTVLYSDGFNGAPIDSAKPYTYTGGRVLAIFDSNDMAEQKVENCSNFDSVATMEDIDSVSTMSYISVKISDSLVCVASMPNRDTGRPPMEGDDDFEIETEIVYLGSNDADIENITSTTQTLDSNGIYWA